MSKTIKLAHVIERANAYLANSPDHMRAARQGVHDFAAQLLMDANVYAGFGYVERYGSPGSDDSRTVFYVHRKLQAPSRPAREGIDCLVIEDDPDGLIREKAEHYDEQGMPRPGIVLQADGYRNGRRVNGLCGIDFYADGGGWTRGAFRHVVEIPEDCEHLRSIARDLGLPE